MKYYVQFDDGSRSDLHDNIEDARHLANFATDEMGFIVSIHAEDGTKITQTSRENVYDVIDTERDFQDDMWGPRDSSFTIGEFLLTIEEYVDKARKQWTNEKKPEVETLHIMRKIAALTVSCMEIHGAFNRENYNNERG